MRLAAAKLNDRPRPLQEPSAGGSTLDQVTQWLTEQRQRGQSTLIPAELVVNPSKGKSPRDAVWHLLALLRAPCLWPTALHALWLGEPVWAHLQREHQWFQVLEAVLMDLQTGYTLARAECPGRCAIAKRPALETLLRATAAHPSLADATVESDYRVTLLIGKRSSLAVRVWGSPPAALRDELQAICFESDAFLEEPMAAALDKQSLMQPLAQKALLRHGPKAAPWNLMPAIRTLVLLGVSALGLVGWAINQELEWQRVIARLDAELGIKVTASRARWGVREIEGLRDSRSVSPAAFLRHQGQNLDHIDLRMDTAVYQESSPLENP